MCWPRSFCCRCPGPSSFAWPPSLTFGRSPRRPDPPQPVFRWGSWPWAPVNSPVPVAPPQPPVISPRRKKRPLHFRSPPPPPLVQGPPPLLALPPPQYTIPFVPQTGPPHLNPDLCSPYGPVPILEWDLTRFPSTARRRVSPHSPDLTALALFPPTPLLTISYASTPILLHWENKWGPIFARAQGAAPGVTVGDVLDAIFVYFNTPLTNTDRRAMSLAAWGVVSDAFRRRIDARDGPHTRAYNEQRGPLRVDVLDRATGFAGLECVGHGYLRMMLCACS
ncbi:hypothetical protein DFH06DRAFT_1211126 [Mycena polygramma]|nr:hypothetical protein DFH06DRAFT_1211126 [Mycena polygramma]